MILDPAILALLAGSVLVVLLAAGAAVSAFQILRRWQPQSGDEGQLRLERKTYLVSVLLAYVFGFELLSFFLFIHTADGVSRFFTGAMCAAGSLNVNGFGYPALLAKLLVSLLAGVWLVLNHVDNKAEDYPLTRTKYRFFLWIAPLVIVEAVLQAAYFIALAFLRGSSHRSRRKSIRGAAVRPAAGPRSFRESQAGTSGGASNRRERRSTR